MTFSLSSQILYELKSIVFGPHGFIYYSNSFNKIPVFVYHTIEPALFEAHLQYLKDNGYKTLSIHEYIDETNKRVNSKSVLLTIDDARTSVWRFAFPLLMKYEMKATVFMIPGLTRDSDKKMLNLSDVWNNKSTLDEIYNADLKDDHLCSWQEISEMYHSGLINIESHTLFHSENFKSFKVVSFLEYGNPFDPHGFPGSPYLTKDDIGKELKPEDYLDLTLFESEPLMLAGPRLNISSEFINKCKEIFNSNKKWKDEITDLVKNSVNIKKYLYLQPDSKAEVAEDLSTARELIQSKLDKNAGNHLCLPWTIGNSETIKILKDLGIKSCFWGAQPVNGVSKKDYCDKYYIQRIKNDFVYRLPGKNRKSLLSIYAYKLQRRLKKEKVF